MMPDPRKLYRRLLKLYPARFRDEYETPLQRQFLDDYQEIQGKWGRARFWIRALADLAISIPRETLGELRQDLGYAARVYRRRSVSTMLAVVALALAIGATTGVFSVVNALLLRSLPFRNPERLVELQNILHIGDIDSWRKHSAYLEEASLYRTEEMNLSTTHEARRVIVAETNASFFKLLGKDPEVGRPFAEGEDTPGREDVAVIGYGLWQQFFGGAPSTLGSTIHINGVPLTVIGIAPPGLDYPEKSVLWTPTINDGFHLSRAHAITRGTCIGRLKPGITFARAESMYRADMAARSKVPLLPADLNSLRVISLRNLLAGDVRMASLVLLGIVLFVLLTACANVAHLLLSRIAERRHEMVLRAALGATRSRLLQQLITESTVLTVCAAAAGLLVAHWASRLAASVQPAQLEMQDYNILDWPVLGFAMGIAVLTGFVFGVLPANLISRLQPGIDPLRTHSGAPTRGIRRMRAVLITMQTTLTLVLLTGSLTMGRSFLRISETDLGLKTDHVVTVSVALSGTPEEGHGRSYIRAALERLRAVPGVESAGAVEYLPLVPNAFAGFPFKLDGQGEAHLGALITATPDYMRTMGTQILGGRDFTPAEERSSAPVAIVNETFARQFDPALRLVGRTLFFPDPIKHKPLTVVGVARTERYRGSMDQGMPQIFMLAELGPALNTTFVARVHGKTEAYLPICRDAVHSVDPRVPVFNVETFEQRLSDSLARPRFYTTVVVFFGGFALLLAAVGIYGVASFSVAQRAHEIGVRMAVGASPRRLRAMLLRESLLPVAAGMVAGIAGAALLGTLIEHLMNGADAVGVVTCAFAAMVLLATAAIAVWTATRRIVQMDPMRVLRTE